MLMEKFITNILNHKGLQALILILSAVAVTLSIMLISPFEVIKMKVLPPKDGQTLNIYIDLPRGSTLSTTKQSVATINKILEQEKDVVNLETYYGMGAPTDLVGLIKGTPLRSGEHSAQIVVNLTKAHERDEKSFLIAQRIRKNIDSKCEYPSDILVVEEPAGPPVIGGMVAEVYGADQKTREQIATKVADIFSRIDGLVDVDIQKQEPFKKFTIEIDKDKAIKFGLSIEQINKIVFVAFEGADIAFKNELKQSDQIALHLVLDDNSKKLTHRTKHELELKLSELKLMNPQGRMIGLNEVISIHEDMSSIPIYSKNLEDFTMVSAETDLISPIYTGMQARSMIQEELKNDFEITHGAILEREKGKYFDLYLKDKTDGKIYQVVWEGELQVSLDAAVDLTITLIVSITLIMTLLIFYYKSFSLPMIVLVGSFLSLIGVMAGHIIINIFSKHTVYFTGTSLVGVIALIGISARNTVLLIDNMIGLIKTGVDKKEAIITSTVIRAKPILLTAGGVMLGSSLLIPDSVFGGLGISLTFGTVTATMASLVIAPILLLYTKE